jgi:ParB/RepB/Spo0J family partition protein
MNATTKPRRSRPGERNNLAANGDSSADVGTAEDRYDPALPLERIVPSGTNPRRTFDEAELAELAESIRTKGVLEPILVRPLSLRVVPGREGGKQGFLVERLDAYGQPIAILVDSFGRRPEDCEKRLPVYELVAGERRWRASQLAGRATIPARIRSLSDLEALEIQLVENLQRADLDPVEEALGLQRLLDTHGRTIDDLAAQLGKSRTQVYGSLKLTLLPEIAREAIRQGRLSKNHGILIGRIPNEKLRVRATEAILRPEAESGPLGFRAAKELIEEQFMTELKGAPFDRRSLTLLPEAGSCEACPKRTGNNREEYPEGRADVCTDPECFRAKRNAHIRAAEAFAADKGATVLRGREAKRALSFFGSGYQDLAAPCPDDPKRRSYKQLVGEVLEDSTVTAVDDDGRLHYLVPRDLAQAALADLNIKPAKDHDSSQRQRDLDRRQAQFRAWQRRLWAAIEAATENGAQEAALLRLLLARNELDVPSDVQAVLDFWCLPADAAGDPDEGFPGLETMLAQRSLTELRRAFLFLRSAGEWDFDGLAGSMVKQIAQVLEIDLKDVAAQAKAAKKARRRQERQAARETAKVAPSSPAPPATQSVPGADVLNIDVLGLAAADLDAAYIADKTAGPAKAGRSPKPISVLPVRWEGRLWVNTGGVMAPDYREWELAPLYEDQVFQAQFGPRFFTRFHPGLIKKQGDVYVEANDVESISDQDRAEYYTGVVIRVRGKDYAIGPRREHRTVRRTTPDT